jgi:hypothetical protein
MTLTQDKTVTTSIAIPVTICSTAILDRTTDFLAL